MIDQYIKRRRQFTEQMDDNSVAIIPGSKSVRRNSDVEYPFRQDSDFHYLTGFDEENAILVMDQNRSVIFLRPSNPEMEIWNGYRLGVEKASQTLGCDEAYPVNEFDEKVPDFLKGKRNLYYAMGMNTRRDNKLINITNQLLRRSRAGETGPSRIIHPGEILHEMRIIKSPEEIERLRFSANVSAEAHLEAMKSVRPGMYEYELEAVFHYYFRKNNSRTSNQNSHNSYYRCR